jgi:hypothetical protein
MNARRQFGVIVTGFAWAGLMLGLTLAQEKSKHERLQPYWNQLNLSEKQRDSYDKVVRKYRDKIKKLEDDLEEIKKQRAEEWASILTASQKSQLDSLRRSKGKGKSDAADADDDTKTDKAKRKPVGTETSNDEDKSEKTTKSKTKRTTKSSDDKGSDEEPTTKSTKKSTTKKTTKSKDDSEK